MAKVFERKIDSNENGMIKRRILKDFAKLDKQLQDQVRVHHPNGFTGNLISFYDRNGKRITAVPFETSDTIYMLKVVASNPVKKIRKKDVAYAEDYFESSELDYPEYSSDDYFDEGEESEE